MIRFMASTSIPLPVPFNNLTTALNHAVPFHSFLVQQSVYIFLPLCNSYIYRALMNYFRHYQSNVLSLFVYPLLSYSFRKNCISANSAYIFKSNCPTFLQILPTYLSPTVQHSCKICHTYLSPALSSYT